MNYQRSVTTDPRRYVLPEKDCERLSRQQLYGEQLSLALISVVAHLQDDMKERLLCIPHGPERMRMAVGGLRAVVQDILGTVPQGQVRQIVRTLSDMDVRLVPRMTPVSQNVVMTRDTAMELIDCGREKCKSCTEDGESCRNCKLYQLLEETTPLDDYGDGMLCPYSLQDWI